ncbi:hypothetical protein [Riemerella columbina]|uniref:hypothetical protein n=1 Tax=Riemerella columbina TaxID=103810 RepID=UPI00036D56D2|nr:hypothetical protein [Riemerella columbina]
MALCRRLKASGNHSIFALGSKQKAISHSLIKTHHSNLALCSKQQATSHSKLTVGDTLNAIMLNLFTHSVLLYIYGFVNFQFQHLTEWMLYFPILKTLKQVQGDTVISAVGFEQQAISHKLKATSYSKLITSHSNFAVGFKPKATSHLSLNPFHFYLAVGSKP